MLREQFPTTYRALAAADANGFMTSPWAAFTASLERELLPYPPFDFLNAATVMRTMFAAAGGAWLREELAFLRRHVPEETLRSILVEEYAGDPLVLDSRYLTSHNTVHHLYHLVRFTSETGCRVADLSRILEWGGGYGNLARLWWRLRGPGSTYVIVDLPLLACLQWLYLATTVGEDSVHLLRKAGDAVVDGKINLVPLCFLDAHASDVDLFVSTWALSECSPAAQRYVRERGWFRAKHLLLAYNARSREFLDGVRLGEAASSDGAVVAEIPFLPGHRYAFR